MWTKKMDHERKLFFYFTVFSLWKISQNCSILKACVDHPAKISSNGVPLCVPKPSFRLRFL